jgi:inositol phosphorylceramide mannosyltransferase catalytic subunit
MRRVYMVIFVCLSTILTVPLIDHTTRYVLRRRSPLRLIYEIDVERFANSSWARRRIPRLIHQIWRTHEIPSAWNASYHSVIAKNIDEFKHRLWIDEDMHAFVQKHEPYFYKNTYIKYHYEIQRVDSFRYVLLFHLGGIYIDMDNACNRPFKDLLATLESLDPDASHLAAFPRSKVFGIESDFMISSAGHPLLKQLISRLHVFNHNYVLHFYTIVMSTGPVYVSIQEHFFDSLSEGQAVRALDYKVFEPMFIQKVGGLTWVGRDASIIFYIDSKMDQLLWYGKIFLVSLTILILILLCKRQLLHTTTMHFLYRGYWETAMLPSTGK